MYCNFSSFCFFTCLTPQSSILKSGIWDLGFSKLFTDSMGNYSDPFTVVWSLKQPWALSILTFWVWRSSKHLKHSKHSENSAAPLTKAKGKSYILFLPKKQLTSKEFERVFLWWTTRFYSSPSNLLYFYSSVYYSTLKREKRKGKRKFFTR